MRISWDILARKALFARLALSAASLAARSSRGAAGDERFEMLLVLAQFVDELLAFALSADQIRDIPVDADHAHGPAVRAADRLSHAANGAYRAVRPPHPEVGPVLVVAAERGLDVGPGTRHVFRHEAPGPRVESATELVLPNAIELVVRVVPHQPILLDVPVPDAEPSRIDGELQPVVAHAQTGFAFLQFALTTLSRLDFADQIVERRLEPASHVVERLREGSQFLQLAARHPRAQVSASHGLRRARNVPERRGHR